jgi:hypothetical protein
MDSSFKEDGKIKKAVPALENVLRRIMVALIRNR